MFKGIYPEGNFSWHHLWFLPYLLVFSIILTPFFLQIRNHPESNWLRRLRKNIDGNPYFLLLFTVPLYIFEAFLEPFFEVTHNLVWDWFNFTSSLTLFFYGFLLISLGETFWVAVGKIWKPMLALGVLAFSIMLCIWFLLEDSILVHFTEALIKVTNLWAWIIAIFGVAAQYLNKNSNTLAYANRAVYPFYILHQTITVWLGFYVYDQPWGFWQKFIFLLLGTFLGSFILYEALIRRVSWISPLFGLKRH
jgi:hypothetical protein